ncbi:MAG: zinc-binding dehydrogenase [Phototrophicaceae bacterium]|jgi:NADPH:quinone reductase-like Zn-dependent oxidoreductase
MTDHPNQQIVVTAYGATDTLQLVEASIPTPQNGQVLLKIEAAGVAFADILMRRGIYPNNPTPPFTPGYEVVGVVEAVGAGVDAGIIGQRMAALTVTGGYSRYLSVALWRCVPVPAAVDAVEAVALVLNYLTAHQMLHRVVRAKAGESALVHSAAGGVGTALLQLGKLNGLTLYGTASKAKHDLVRELGATPIDYTRDDFVDRVDTLTGDGVDIAFDPIGGDHWIRSYRTLRLGGTLVIYGYSTTVQGGQVNRLKLLPSILQLGALLFVPDGRRIASYLASSSVEHALNAYHEDLTYLLGLLAGGQIKPVIGERLPLAEAARAHRLLEEGAVRGKIVLMMD